MKRLVQTQVWTGVAIFGDHRAFDGAVDVGIVEDDERRVAAELHRDAFQGLGRLLDQQLAIGVEPVR